MVLYTEMVTTGGLLHGDRPRFLDYDPAEHPIALQLGGSDPEALAKCAVFAEQWGYDEVNLNVGCPSDRVQEGRIGACLMAEPKLVADCVLAMGQATSLPITVKTRLGIDEDEDFDHLLDFVKLQVEAGAGLITLHARKAWLQGLSPKQNREVPPLRYEWVYRVKELLPDLVVEINGGITRPDEVMGHLEKVDSVMLGRAVQDNPWILRTLAHLHGPEEGLPSNRHDALIGYSDYVQEQLELGRPLAILTRNLLGLFHGLKGAKRWRQALSNHDQKTFAHWRALVELAGDLESGS